jgi:hypothetical protein
MRLGYIWRQLGWKQIKILTAALVIAGLFFGLFIWRLGTLTPGISTAEASARLSSSTFHGIINNPINAPQSLIQMLFHYLNPGSIFLLRLTSVIWACVFILCFYHLAGRWFGRVVGSLSTLLFASTPWFILSSRSAGPMIMLLMPLAIAASYTWAIKRKCRVDLAAIALAVVVSIGIYTPGTLWFIIVATYFARKQLKAFITRINTLTLVLCLLTILVILTPLTRAIVLDWEVIKPLLLIPTTFIGVYGFIKAFAWSSLAIVWRTRNHLDMSIGRWPMLNTVQAVLLIFGVIAMSTQALGVGCMLMIFIILSIFAGAINSGMVINNGSAPLVFMALPALSMFVAAGLRYLYIEWKSIFPRNPLPKTLAISLMVVLVAMQIFFGIRYALVAWPHTADTLSLYVLK